jgi:hypothetical protein
VKGKATIKSKETTLHGAMEGWQAQYWADHSHTTSASMIWSCRLGQKEMSISVEFMTILRTMYKKKKKKKTISKNTL